MNHCCFRDKKGEPLQRNDFVQVAEFIDHHDRKIPAFVGQISSLFPKETESTMTGIARVIRDEAKEYEADLHEIHCCLVEKLPPSENNRRRLNAICAKAGYTNLSFGVSPSVNLTMDCAIAEVATALEHFYDDEKSGHLKPDNHTRC